MKDDHVYALECQAGESASFGILYDRYIEKIYRFIYYKTFSKEVTEDLVSDVFTKALEKIHSYQPEKGPFSAWLYRIARNGVIDYYRTRKSTVTIDDTFELSTDDRTAEAHDAVNALGKVTEYLKTLTPKQREIITLRVWEEKSYREIAEIVGGTEDSVKMAFSRSIRDVREQCGPFALTVLMCALGNMHALPFTDLS